jgi:hypothetical protein
VKKQKCRSSYDRPSEWDKEEVMFETNPKWTRWLETMCAAPQRQRQNKERMKSREMTGDKRSLNKSLRGKRLSKKRI